MAPTHPDDDSPPDQDEATTEAPTHPVDVSPNPDPDGETKKVMEKQIAEAVKKLMEDEMPVAGRGYVSISLQYTPDENSEMDAADIPVPTILRRADGPSRSSPGAFALGGGGLTNRTMQTQLSIGPQPSLNHLIQQKTVI